ncbi:MAG: hypothetical protein RMK50_04660 [Nitrososphaerota archaeon]|nr:hypothetical protein [Candidatus Bathyarchaeota archaeon]MDW8194091.1 hypothetical protein [Nitrososphaerota archaeon]
MQHKRAAIHALALSIIMLLLYCKLPYAFGWNPATTDLAGTESSLNTYADNNVNNRFDIYAGSSICGMQAGEDSASPDSIAFLMKLDVGQTRSTRFTVSRMSSGDQYEVYFSIGGREFCILFRATEGSRGTCTLFNRTGGSWSSRVSLTVNSIVSGTLYSTTDYKIGFILTDATRTSYGSIKFIISKQYLYDLGARGNLVAGIYATARSGGTGTPGTGVLMDRCPASSYASWVLQGDIPDLPAGILLLAFPLIAIYVYLKRSKGMKAYGLKISC